MGHAYDETANDHSNENCVREDQYLINIMSHGREEPIEATHSQLPSLSPHVHRAGESVAEIQVDLNDQSARRRRGANF